MYNGIINFLLSLYQLGKNLIAELRLFKKSTFAAIIIVAFLQLQVFATTAGAQEATFQAQLPHAGYLSSQYTRTHQAIDIATTLRAPIKPIAAGVIKDAGFSYYGLGYNVTVDHKNGYSSNYGHMGKIYVKVGQEVSLNDYIGEVGLTGNTTGPHTHLEIFKDGVRINPLTVLSLPTSGGNTLKSMGAIPQVISSVGGGLSQLPKTGLPLLGAGFLALLPFGWKMRKVGNTANKSLTANSVWEVRAFSK